MTRALADQPSLGAAAARLVRASAGLAGLQAGQGPQAGLGADLTRQRYSAHGLVPPSLAGSTRDTVNLQASGSVELDFFGRQQPALQAALGQQQAAAAELQAARVLLSANVARAYVGLARLLALRDLTTQTLAQRQAQLDLLPQRLGADLLGRRADVVAARWRVETALQDMAVARTQFYPDINLVGFVGLNALGLGNLLNLGSRNLGIGPALRLPLFDGGRLRANLQGRAADADAATAAYNGAVLDAAREVADASTSLQSLARQRVEQAQALAATESAYDLALQRYRAGLGSYLVVLSAETGVLAQRQQATDLQARLLDNQVALMRALGGGWQAAPALALNTAPAPAR